MNSKLAILSTEIKEFFRCQYFVIILIITVGFKLSYFSSLIGINYPFDHMIYGYMLSFLTATILLYPMVFLKHKKKISLTFNLVLTVLLLLDLAYYRFFQSLPTFGLLSAINQTGDITSSISNLLIWQDLLLFADILLVYVLEYFLRKKQPRKPTTRVFSTPEKALGVLLVLVIVMVSLGFRYIEKPRQILADAVSRSLETRTSVEYFGILGGHLIDGYRYFIESTAVVDSATKAPIINWVKTNLSRPQVANIMTGTAKNKRVIMIQVESLANFPIGSSINGQEITPNLNALLGNSHYFTDHRYVIGAGHTSDTDFVVNSSIYPLYDSSVFVRYGRDNFSGLPEVVGDSGYTTAAYHAYNRSFWNRDAAFNSLGYQRFYAAESYPRGTTYNINGLNDQSFLQKTLDYLEKEPENSLNFIITLSSHFPYKMDSNSSTLSLEGQNIPKVAGDYFQSIHYTDMAIGEFIEGLKNKGLYDDTLILIYGDHNAPYVEGFSIGDFVYDPYSLEGLRIPLIIKTPNQTTGLTHNKATTTLDIAPTILDLLGLKTDMPMFGESLFASDATSLPRCIGGEVIHIGAFVDCEAEIKAEKEIAAKIIKYNLFDTFRVR